MPANLDPGTEFAGHLIEAEVGRGGMGIVYRARHHDLDRIRALKVIGPEFAEDDEFPLRFHREFRLAASLDHPNVIPIHHAGEQDGRLFMAMQLRRRAPTSRRCSPTARALERTARILADGRGRRSTPRTRPGSSTATSSPPTSCSGRGADALPDRLRARHGRGLRWRPPGRPAAG